MPDRAFQIWVAGERETYIVFASSASRARHRVVHNLRELNWPVTYRDVRVLRAPEHDPQEATDA